MSTRACAGQAMAPGRAAMGESSISASIASRAAAWVNAEAHGATLVAKPRKRPIAGLPGGRLSSLRRSGTKERLGPRHLRGGRRACERRPHACGGGMAAARRVALAGAPGGPEPRAPVRAGTRNGKTSWPFGMLARTPVNGQALGGRLRRGSTRAGLDPESGNFGRPLVHSSTRGVQENLGALWPFGSQAPMRKPPEAPRGQKQTKNFHPPPPPFPHPS